MHSDQEDRLFGALKRIQDTVNENGRKLDDVLAAIAVLGEQQLHVPPSRIDELTALLNSEDYGQGKVSVEIKPDGTVVTGPVDPGPQATENETGVGDATEETTDANGDRPHGKE